MLFPAPLLGGRAAASPAPSASRDARVLKDSAPVPSRRHTYITRWAEIRRAGGRRRILGRAFPQKRALPWYRL